MILRDEKKKSDILLSYLIRNLNSKYLGQNIIKIIIEDIRLSLIKNDRILKYLTSIISYEKM